MEEDEAGAAGDADVGEAESEGVEAEAESVAASESEAESVSESVAETESETETETETESESESETESESESESASASARGAGGGESASRSGGALWGRRILASVLGVLVGLAAAEYAFAARDKGAYPHLNCYMPSAEHGLALEPGSRTRLSFQGNPVTDVRINSDGFRGPELAEGRDDEILILGDSQAFGLGVEDHETLGAVLGELTQRQVINAGVPTYGPLEYVGVAREVFETRSPTTVVVIVNMANDFFEHSRPNTERHAVWDGWAVRAETAPHEVSAFPGREWLFRRSHAFFALRSVLHSTDDTIEAIRDTGFSSEGTLRDLMHGGAEASEAHEEASQAHAEEIAAHHARIAGIEGEIEVAETEIDEQLAADIDDSSMERAYRRDDPDLVVPFQARAARGHPGDIVGSWDSGESGRDVLVTATLLNRGVRLRRRLEARVRGREGGEEIGALIDRRAELRGELATERARGLAASSASSVLEPRIRELAELVRENGAELVVVGLPLDVVVDDAEFEKYGHEVVDVSDASILLGDLVTVSHRLGARAFDATAALRADEPGAFLMGDLHLSPSGHRAVATAIRDTMVGPNPFRQPDPGLPEGRSAVPEPDEYLHAVELNATGSTAANCGTDLVREWLRITCRRSERSDPTRVELIEGGHSEALTVTTPASATLLAPVFAGDDLVADFHWSDRTQRLTLHWPEGAEVPEMSFGERLDPVYPEAVEDPGAARLCECHIEVHGWNDCASDSDWECGRSCQELYGAASAECLAAYTDECGPLLRCARGDPEVPPPCEEGRVNALGTQRCLNLCREGDTCEEGTCEPWQGGNVCVPGGAFASEEPGPPIVLDPRTLPRSAVPTVASIGGERCRVQTLGETARAQWRRAVATPSGALVASRYETTVVQAFDASGVPRGEPVEVGFERARIRGLRNLEIELVRVGERNLLGYVYPCAGGYCLQAVAVDDDGSVLGEPFDAIEVGDGGQGGLAMLGGDEEAWVAFGSARGAIHVERWTVDERGAIERTLVAESGTGLPTALAVDGEHWAMLWHTAGLHGRLQIDGGTSHSISPPVSRGRSVLLLEGERAEVRARVNHRSTRIVLNVGDEAPVSTEIPQTLPERLPVDTPVRLAISPRGSLLRRLHGETHLPVSRPISMPGGGPAAAVWAGNGVLVFDTHVRLVHCR